MNFKANYSHFDQEYERSPLEFN